MPTKSFIAPALALTGTAFVLSTATPANALTFNWSFVTDAGSTGGAGQTVSGTIRGLVEGNNPGTGLTIAVDSTPTGELLGGGWDFDGTGVNSIGRAFTVTGGTVTFADVVFRRGDAILSFGGFGGVSPVLSDLSDFNPIFVSNFPNTFTPVSTPTTVPEPGSALALLGLGALGVVGRKLKR